MTDVVVDIVVVVVVVGVGVGVVGAAGGGGVVVTPCSFFSQSRSGRKLSNSLCVCVFFETLGTKNTDVCCASEAQNHGIYDVFFGQHRAKTLVFAQLSACTKK